MTTSLAPSSQNPLQGLAGPLHELGTGIGADTPLGAWLMSELAAPTVVIATAVLALLMLLGWRRRRARAARRQGEVQAAPVAAATEPVVTEDPVRTHPEALAMLYDAPSRREPVLSAAAAAAPQPVAVAAVPQASTASSSPPASDQGGREQASLRLMVSAVDRLLQRVESQQAQIHALLDELKAQSSALLVQGERLLELEARVAGLGGASASAAAGGTTGPAAAANESLSSLDQAIALAAGGAGEQELVNQLGLSAAEARLINLVHGQSAGTVEPPSVDAGR